MLANGTKLYYSETQITATASGWVELPDLKEIPDMGVDPEKVEDTGLNDANKQYDMGIGDQGDTNYQFKYPSTVEAYATSAWKKGREWQASNQIVYFKEVMKDGFTSVFGGQVVVKRNGGGVNSPVAVTLSIALKTDITYTDPVS